jgi:hypothetical protein
VSRFRNDANARALTEIEEKPFSSMELYEDLMEPEKGLVLTNIVQLQEEVDEIDS